MDKIRKFFKRDKFAEFCGIEIVDISPGKAKVKMTAGPEHCNGVEAVHGGAIFTLADYAFAVACNSHGTIAVAINVNISFVTAGKIGPLFAEAVEVSKNHKIGTYDVKVTDGDDNLIASFQGMAYRKNKPLPGLEDQ